MTFGTNFYDAERQSHADIQDEFASQWRFHPRHRPINRSSTDDPTRESFELRAVFQLAPRHMMMGMHETGFSSRDPTLTAERCSMRGAVRQGDIFEYVCGGADELQTGDLFEITDVKPDGVSGIEFSLVQMGPSPGAAP